LLRGKNPVGIYVLTVEQKEVFFSRARYGHCGESTSVYRLAIPGSGLNLYIKIVAIATPNNTINLLVIYQRHINIKSALQQLCYSNIFLPFPEGDPASVLSLSRQVVPHS
jgi:hypothetical protein